MVFILNVVDVLDGEETIQNARADRDRLLELNSQAFQITYGRNKRLFEHNCLEGNCFFCQR